MTAHLIFDLDDTLVDTFELLIRPLETDAAEALHQQGFVELSPDALRDSLLEVRRRDPAAFYDVLRRLAHGSADAAVTLHRSHFTDFPVEALVLDPARREMLETLKTRHKLVLMTEGRRDTQLAKIRHLALGDIFDEFLVVDPSVGEDKRDSLARYLARAKIGPHDAIVIGNRLDREIAAGMALGTRTVWLRAGEGSEISQTGAHAAPDRVIEDLADLPGALAALDG
jgi:FMN phosphatase YigB (HAD superfamily)